MTAFFAPGIYVQSIGVALRCTERSSRSGEQRYRIRTEAGNVFPLFLDMKQNSISPLFRMGEVAVSASLHCHFATASSRPENRPTHSVGRLSVVNTTQAECGSCSGPAIVQSFAAMGSKTCRLHISKKWLMYTKSLYLTYSMNIPRSFAT